MIKAVIFDFDGVLVDSERLHFKTHKRALKKFGVDLNVGDYRKLGMAKGSRSFYRKLGEKCGVDLDIERVQELRHKYFVELIESIKPAIGVVDLLDSLKDKYKLAVASRMGPKTLKELMEKTGLKDFFRVIMSGADCRRNKPWPDVYLAVAEKLGVQPEECAVVEDSISGVGAGKKAGMKVFGLMSGFMRKEDLKEADVIVNSLEELNDEVINS
ncbi:HAD family phosphatase [Patescibacteria group bacterium]|nr:HAD family phosphatase [Patescibacteria group bacterium]